MWVVPRKKKKRIPIGMKYFRSHANILLTIADFRSQIPHLFVAIIGISSSIRRLIQLACSSIFNKRDDDEGDVILSVTCCFDNPRIPSLADKPWKVVNLR